MGLPSGLAGELHGFVVQALRLCVQLAILALIFVPLEHFVAVRRQRVFYRGWAVNLAYYFLNSVTPVLLLAPLAALLAQGMNALLPWRLTHLAAGLPLWGRVAGAMVVGEVGYYWGHRLCHEVPLLWRFHAVHHSAEHVSFLVNGRAHPFDMVFGRLAMLVPMYALGFADPFGGYGNIPVALIIFGLIWGYVIHANIRWRLGPLEQVLASPAFHHWHHTRDDHKDRNYSTMLPFIDRMFGTFYLPRHWPAEYGTSTPMPGDVLGQLIAPFEPPPAAEVATEKAS